MRFIATQVGRSPSTISREISRNGGYAGYRATQADQAAWDRAHRPKACKLSGNRFLSRTVAEKLRLFWSPQQIAGWLKIEFSGEEHNHVSHETIYRSLFVQARGVLKKELLQHLRTKRTIRRSSHASLKDDGLGKITDTVSISERPASVEDRAVPGHWEGDLIAGSNGSHIATLVERHSRYVMLARVESKNTDTVIQALIKQSHKLPGELYKSLTWDRGSKISNHKRFTLSTDWDRTTKLPKLSVNLDFKSVSGATQEAGLLNEAGIPITSAGLFGDEDNDDMQDDWESDHGLNPANGDDATLDGDIDQLSNLEEFRDGTDPQLDDTDSDGLKDGFELENELDPLDGAGCPAWMCGGGFSGWRVILLQK
jgi:IS30 family transposase